VPRYRIVPERSHVWIDARSNVHPIHSETDGLEGFVELEMAPDGSVDLAHKLVGQLSLPVSRLSSGNRMEDREMQKRIDAQKFPTIEGVLDEMVPDGNGNGSYRVRGNITFRGVARDYEDEMTVGAVDGRTIQLAGKSRFDIRDFGMQPPRVLMLRIEPEVDIRVEIIAVTEP
jgi:polyisoprenoid-binding protein YceI